MLDFVKKMIKGDGDRPVPPPIAVQAAELVVPTQPEVKVIVQPTPNPYAFKFITNREVIHTGKVSYNNDDDCGDNQLAHALFALSDVSQVHFFENVITVTFAPSANLIMADVDVVDIIKRLLPDHSADIKIGIDEDKRRAGLSPDLLKIDEILDNTIRPGLQGDGGDIEVLELKEGKLYVRYQGACGSCPSSTQGTLMALEGILKEQFDPDIQVIPI